MTYRIAAVIISAVIALVGVFVLIRSATVFDARVGTVACGSPLFPDRSSLPSDSPDEELAIFTDLRSQCDNKLSSQRTAGYSVLGIGALGLLFCGLTSPRLRRSVQPSSTSTAERVEQQ